ncbi:uncharacterized protein [Argopecten irradians]|uniref:uncharacterized protein n=1 Tax=Argopecten irradians TaxID=31199 RepID=UPI003721A2F9
MSSSSASSSGACQSQAPAGLPGGVKGDNPEGDQGGGNSSVNQPQPSQSVNKPQPSQSVNKPQPSQSVNKPQPSQSVNQPQPSQSVNKPQPSQSVNQPQPSQSVNQPQPSQSVNKPQPSQSVNQPQPSQSVNKPQPSQSVNKPQPSQSVNKAYSYGPSSLRQAAGQMKDDGQEGGAQGDRKPSVSDFHNLDFSGHFKIKLPSRKDKQSVLKLKVNEEQFVKFCHLFHCELQLEALEQTLLSDLKVNVTGDGYPPSICPQEGASHPIDISINRVLTSLCCQLKAVNISSTSWNTDQVKDTLSLLDSYHKGIVIGYDVSSDDTNCWLVGERGAIKTTMEALGQQLVPFRYQQTDQQEPNVKETTSDNRPTAQTRSDNKQTGQSGSDDNQTAQTGLDNRQTSQTDLDRQKRPSGVNADIERSGSENKPLEQVESNIRCLGLPESGDRQSGQSGSSQSETDKYNR